MHAAAPGHAGRSAPSAVSGQDKFCPSHPCQRAAGKVHKAVRAFRQQFVARLTLSKASKSLHYINFEFFLVI